MIGQSLIDFMVSDINACRVPGESFQAFYLKHNFYTSNPQYQGVCVKLCLKVFRWIFC